jgi:hypothetical protein
VEVVQRRPSLGHCILLSQFAKFTTDIVPEPTISSTLNPATSAASRSLSSAARGPCRL